MTVRSRMIGGVGKAINNIQVEKAVEVANKGSNGMTSIFSSISRMTTNKMIGTCIWLLGAWLTVQTLLQLGVGESFATVGGIILQLAFTRAESPIWRGRGLSKFSAGALVADTLINSAGAWPYTKQIGNTDFWTMVKDVMQSPNSVPSVPTTLTFALLVGIGTAAAAEYYWNLPERTSE